MVLLKISSKMDALLNKPGSATKNTFTEVEINGEIFFKISQVDEMRPFFTSIVSDSNHWLFVSSNGGISAGRKNPDFALFPYYTDDKIMDTAEITGSKTIFRVNRNNETILWEPFSIRSEGNFKISRNLYQNRFSNKIIFEEINIDLGLCFQYEWNTSDQYGFVKHSRLKNLSGEAVAVAVVDGLQNILPYGVPSSLQTTTSNLADAYKRAELVAATGLGVFSLSAIIVDKAEPSEALKANVVWSLGLQQPTYLLSVTQLQHFRNGKKIIQEEDIKGEKGAYFITGNLLLEAEEEKQWMTVANLNQNHAAVIKLNESIKEDKGLYKKVQDDIELGSTNLQALIAAADGFQYTAGDLKDTRHFSNVLFNIMRGGVPDNNYKIEKWDFSNYLEKANKKVYENTLAYIDKLADIFSVFELAAIAKKSGDNDLIRLATEYLPLKFSRRHGDPSRPWNNFSINTKSDIDGSKILDYQGNWRDIFQNWEALAHSYPAFIEAMIYKFLNASTFDGYNPYRVTKDGFDWEIIEPENPWSYIGYWGDHQIIYLLKFLEFAEQHKSGAIAQMLSQDGFVYANVPYRIKSYTDIVNNPKDTIEFDHINEKQIHERIKQTGADGALLTNKQGEIYRVNFLEKILATVLSKLSNFIPEGGIWMNTQRPEWNDANNALVGNGVSMVTLYYLRRFLKFFQPVFEKDTSAELSLSSELCNCFESIKKTFEQHKDILSGKINDAARKQVTDALGEAGSNYRNSIYANSFSGEKKIIIAGDLSAFVNTSLQFLEHSIRANKRTDNLYHAYNLLSYTDSGISISHLSEMLEGQVGVLSSGCLSANESLQLLDALRQSSLYRKDQNSYLLYPAKELPLFLQKNSIPQKSVEGSALLTKLVNDGNRSLIEKDVKGAFHFNGDFRNAEDVKQALQHLGAAYQLLVAKENKLVLQIFEEVFNHKEFTGRSGTFFAFEGLGSIYWHMVSKLAVAANETCIRAIAEKEDEKITNKLIEHYYEICDGIGVHKSPQVYGAFSFTPYSHTPVHKGAQQPGMTGQVKEDILCRIAELGIAVKNNRLVFHPVLLKKNEFIKEEKEAVVIDVSGRRQIIHLEKDSLLFTYCQVPVMYIISDSEGLDIERNDGTRNSYGVFELNEKDTASVLNRNGAVKLIKVYLSESHLIQ